MLNRCSPNFTYASKNHHSAEHSATVRIIRILFRTQNTCKTRTLKVCVLYVTIDTWRHTNSIAVMPAKIEMKRCNIVYENYSGNDVTPREHMACSYGTSLNIKLCPSNVFLRIIRVFRDGNTYDAHILLWDSTYGRTMLRRRLCHEPVLLICNSISASYLALSSYHSLK
jgi:hypothetical protein